MSLTASQIKAFRLSLLDAFRTRASLRIMLNDGLGLDLNVFDSGGTLAQAISVLIDDAEASGWLERLVRAAHAANPKNAQIAAVVNDIGLVAAAEVDRPNCTPPVIKQDVSKAELGASLVVVLGSFRERRYLAELTTHLDPVLADLSLDFWHSGMVQVARRHLVEAAAKVEKAAAILLLISPHILAGSGNRKLIARAIERNRREGVKLLPILLRPVSLVGTPMEGVKLLPRSGKPVVKLSSRDDAWVEVVETLHTTFPVPP